MSMICTLASAIRRFSYRAGLILVLALVASLWPHTLSASEHTIFFPETDMSVSFGFKRFFEERGGLDIFGYPITPEIQEHGFTVQYFQRARFEYHPEHAGTRYEVQLGLLGDILTSDRDIPQGGTGRYDGRPTVFPGNGPRREWGLLALFQHAWGAGHLWIPGVGSYRRKRQKCAVLSAVAF